MTAAPEFSRPILLARIGAGPFHQEIAANEAERAALAGRFELLALDRLSATVELTRRGSDLILLHAVFEAEFVQQCVVTLEPVAGTVLQEFSLLYGPPEVEEAAAGTVEDAITFEPLSRDWIDIGEAVAQEFSLALPAFPRSPEADAGAAPPADADGPFSVLSQILDRHGRDTG